jgi:uncharacterized protein YqeY
VTTLKERIQDDVKSAMRAKEKERLGTLRLITAAFKQREVDERIDLDDAAVVEILTGMVKQRHDSITQYDKAGREDLSAVEHAELAIIAEYMPAPLSAEEVAAAIAEAIAKTGAESMKDMGKVMGILKPQLQGRADMGAVSKQIKDKLSGN